MMSVPDQYVPLSFFADRPLVLAPEEYPNQAWRVKTENYNEWWAYYQGFKLFRKADPDNPDSPYIFPFRLNIIRAACILHAAALIGQTDADENIVQFGIATSRQVPRELALETADFLNNSWAANTADESFVQQALFQQIFGGFYYYLRWDVTRQKYPIQYFPIDPRSVFPIWDGYDFDRLIGVDIMLEIPKPTAQARYGTALFSTMAQEREFVNVHEHWDENEYWILVDGQIARWADGTEMRGKNPWFDPYMGRPIIPVVYAPRIRAGHFYGDSLIPGLIGPQEEINANIAHLGDGLADAMHQQPWVRDAPKGLQNIRNSSREEWINLGSTQFGSNPPEAGRLPGAKIEQSMIDFVMDGLLSAAREHAGVPDVAWGKTDASIRSALTLAFMMKPYVDYAVHYRRHAANGLKTLSYNTIVMALNKKGFYDNLTVSEEMLEAILLGHRTRLPPVLPQDRIDKVNEVVQRVAAQIISRETAIRRLDGDEDTEIELERIERQITEQHERQMEATQLVNQQRQQQQQQQSPSGGRTNRSQAEGGRRSESR